MQENFWKNTTADTRLWSGRQRCGGRSPDEQQDESVQAPLHGAEPDALDPNQLVGFILTQRTEPAARHDPLPLPLPLLRVGLLTFRGGGISDSFLQLSPSCADGHMSKCLQLLAALCMMRVAHAHILPERPFWPEFLKERPEVNYNNNKIHVVYDERWSKRQRSGLQRKSHWFNKNEEKQERKKVLWCGIKSKIVQNTQRSWQNWFNTAIFNLQIILVYLKNRSSWFFSVIQES